MPVFREGMLVVSNHHFQAPKLRPKTHLSKAGHIQRN
ncbi:unnamed protein product [Brassica oleracea var. botrytis]